MENLLEKLNQTKLICYICKDINIDLLSTDKVLSIKNYTDMVYSLGSIPLIFVMKAKIHAKLRAFVHKPSSLSQHTISRHVFCNFASYLIKVLYSLTKIIYIIFHFLKKHTFYSINCG